MRGMRRPSHGVTGGSGAESLPRDGARGRDSEPSLTPGVVGTRHIGGLLRGHCREALLPQSEWTECNRTALSCQSCCTYLL